MTNPIVDFLEKRKQKPLKEAKKPVAEIEQEFQIAVWGASAANRAAQLSLVSHPGKFSHPDARITPVLFAGEYAADGYVRSGNANAGQDVVGNAAALDVYAFLSVVLDDGRNVLEHFEANSAALKALLAVGEETFAAWRTAFLQIKAVDGGAKTHTNVKQVYFPVAEGYHLLSVLYPSGLMTEHRERLRQMKFSEATKAAREARRKELFHEQGFADMTGLLTLHFGGTKPQNISKLNSNNGGEAWLMPCFPPELQQHYLHLPKADFFQWLRWDADWSEIITALHKLLQTDYNNVEIRQYRQRRIEQLFDWVMGRAVLLQQQPAGWSGAEGFRLPAAQRFWLDATYRESNPAPEQWQETITRSMSEWVVTSYKRFRKKQGDAVSLGEIEVKAFQAEMLGYAREHEEFLL
ncbi:type I-F CRISPR-associated protein Csy1 [Thiothrix subterranea]|uniref:Type I-F CRISPR-associated protein Csy1 n=1 Tax=Thiothrix subterranea TaxID=2735563 RepID=A0AA51MJK4_9GAMM|nr:type I-F CRISPR-associated protein Csy1 [Thiothrix subterranea]MDQ5767689.1 type I-F CRISPR-associated protein Csy1 [Thiothrix subterranea]WML85495.1 type I-F CRISPR-associated protein Csy1 [Thiothrix subterranea]